jgi:hypothetical protein
MLDSAARTGTGRGGKEGEKSGNSKWLYNDDVDLSPKRMSEKMKVTGAGAISTEDSDACLLSSSDAEDLRRKSESDCSKLPISDAYDKVGKM